MVRSAPADHSSQTPGSGSQLPSFQESGNFDGLVAHRPSRTRPGERIDRPDRLPGLQRQSVTLSQRESAHVGLRPDSRLRPSGASCLPVMQRNEANG